MLDENQLAVLLQLIFDDSYASKWLMISDSI